MNLDNNLLKNLTLLYVEDDDVIRLEFSDLLASFFSKVLVAKNGKDGLRIYLENQDKIDVILSDVNMPYLNGIEMIKQIRKIKSNVPVIFATAYSDSEFLIEAIKLRIQEYVVKPIDVRNLLSVFNNLASTLHQELLLKQQQEELTKYKEIIDSNNIVIKTDIHLNITYVNQLFCEISGFNPLELIGKELKSLRYSDFQNDVYTNLYAIVLNNKPWSGRVKNIKDDGTFYYADAFVLPSLDESAQMIGTICILKDITEELNKKREIQLALMREKSDIYIKSKEDSLEQNSVINELKYKTEVLQQELEQALKNIDKYIYNNEKLRIENKNLKTETGLYKKHLASNVAFKMSKENSDLRLELKKIKDKMTILEQEDEKKLTQLKIAHNEKLIELEDKITELNEKLEAVQSDEVLMQKLEYWKAKAKSESQRIEVLEKHIIEYADNNLLNKIFG